MNFLENWLESSNRKPLVIPGARQVGKSTLVRLFAGQQHQTLAEVNLEIFPGLDSVFKTLDVQHIINQIEALPRMPAVSADTMLFLDELQAASHAMPALRYFYMDMGALPLLSAGSLLEFVLADHRFPMPVGRIQYLHMGPMTFSEFLDALGESKLKSTLESYQPGDDPGPVTHVRLLQLLRAYYLGGGMPAAVAVYAGNRKFSEVSPVHNSIIDTYREDFSKYSGSRNLARLLGVFNFSARSFGVKIKYSNISREERSATLKRDIELLSMAGVISKVIHTHASDLPLQADIDEKVYKLLFLDVGLMNAICGLKWRPEMGHARSSGRHSSHQRRCHCRAIRRAALAGAVIGNPQSRTDLLAA